MANHFVHSELMTGDPKKAKQFYSKVFDWKFKEMPAFNYTSVDTGREMSGGGIGKTQSAAQPAAWMPYVAVASVKATVAKAKKAGARVIVDYMSIGDMGALGIFVDPTGASLGVWEMAAPAAKKPAGKKPTAKKTSVTKVAAKTAKKQGKKPAKRR